MSEEIDRKLAATFAGKVVPKDLVRRVKVGANVPVYVLEYLLGKYCASDDPQTRELGLVVVQGTLTEKYVRPDEAQKAQSRVREEKAHSFIDKIRVRLSAEEDIYWAELANFGDRFVHIPDEIVRSYDRLLEGGIWAEVALEYRFDDSETRRRSPFHITGLKPIQLASFRMQEYADGRKAFTRDEWLTVLLRSVGIEAEAFDARQRLLLLCRLLPLVERNYNFIELGPRGTGKSFVYREVSPYSILVSGGRTTVANLFYNMATNRVGLVGLWDAVAFDEVAGLEFGDKTAVQILKDYMEAGSFSRGREEISAEGSLAFIGNLNQPVDVVLRSSHLFSPLPEAMQDMALIDRFHFYLPGWEVPKYQTAFFTDHYGFVTDYLAEALRTLRKQNRADALDSPFALGAHLNARDAKAVRKTVSGLLKLLHPHGEWTDGELREYLELALEGRRRVKEQLKRLGAFEYYQTSFSYFDRETQQERFVGVPEEGGRNLISAEPLAPGTVYAATVDAEGVVALFRVEVAVASGTGRLRTAGGLDHALNESLRRAEAFLRTHRVALGVAKEGESSDLTVQCIDLLGGRSGAEIGVAFFVAMVSALRRQAVQPALLTLGDLTVHGTPRGLPSLMEPLQVAMDNGAKRALIPLENKRQFFEVSGDVLEKVDPVFYSDCLTAAAKAMGVA